MPVVVYEDLTGNNASEDVVDGLVGDDRLWNELHGCQQTEPRRWAMEDRIRWKDANGHTIDKMFENGPFPVSCRNNQLAYWPGGIARSGSEGVEFYVWGDVSLVLCSLSFSRQKGGAAMSLEEDRIVLVQVLLQSMDEVKRFTQMVLPPKDAASYREVTVQGIEPPWKSGLARTTN
ncbi:uncharacterized protein LOC9661360 [Selaginella moellendorffii]|nr:uncharacterized protein LOC9661360 [Selaginella moellendorffii]|eukprot:XP_024518560.1 uncharacterized protein LOC9661360 [Selaginella moellendorffii]